MDKDQRKKPKLVGEMAGDRLRGRDWPGWITKLLFKVFIAWVKSAQLTRFRDGCTALILELILMSQRCKGKK
jgi:hypothetical protein